MSVSSRSWFAPPLGSGPSFHGVRLPAHQRRLLQNRGVHAAPRPSAPQHQRDLVAHPPPPRRIEPRRGRRHVCCENDVVHPQQRIGRGGRLLLEHVQPRRSEEHTSELQSLTNLVCRLLLEKKNTTNY